MREDLLHFIWKYKKLRLSDLRTSRGESLSIINFGRHNHLAGPDFFNAQIDIGGQVWAGNVEMHLRSSDWYAHHHEQDVNYNNVILHVVWEDDGDVFRKDNSLIPTLELRKYIPLQLLQTYQSLFDRKNVHFINCEKDIGEFDDFLMKNWLERLYFERLETKAVFVFDLLKKSNNDWEQVLFTLLLKGFGLKINGAAFLSLGIALEFSIFRKQQDSVFQMESLLFGMAHLLEDDTVLDDYYIELKKEYAYQKRKYGLSDAGVQKPDFFKLRPPNFPTVRLSQLANLYATHQSLFHKVISAISLEELYAIFNVKASAYWDSHYTFGKESRKKTKKLTSTFVDLLVINVILPLQFCYAKHRGVDVNEQIIKVISKIKKENNTVVSNFGKMGMAPLNAKDSQALLQLYNRYCTQNKCLQCVVGTNLLR
ncbi:Protein of unknown function [Zobellia uliginosa]|uniref:DUF2851 domain-containing protein n=1 Tax=Zobellia uliginosa TaxID=143224 RepID=A0ABY1KZ64_9FLAO|nr:DUF2851 family protein [Zobellia uliginosa]SIS95786.1 Protein of unknown function [Zobellia uliginosa]